MEELAARWNALCERLNAAPCARASFDIMTSLYSVPSRQYHSLTHIAFTLARLDEHASLGVRRDEVELALWLHDCVYVPGAPDNELRSADIASLFAQFLGWNADAAFRVRACVLATRHTGEPLSGDPALTADIDLSATGVGWDEYLDAARGIRREFSMFPDAQFNAGRAAFLRSMLERPALFHVPEMRTAYEGTARANFARELSALESARPIS